jgi:dephospho-CoA kinase
MIIGISGYARSGKDTVANYLVEHHEFTRMAFADAMREALLRLNP